MLKLAICEDNAIQCEQIQNLTHSSLRIPYEIDIFVSAEDFLARIYNKKCPYQIILMDIELGSESMSGINLAQKINSSNPNTQIIFISQYLKYASSVYETNHVYAGDCENAQKLIHTSLETFQRERFHPYCEDNLILAILESKRMLAKHAGIQVDYQIFLPEKSVIQPADLSSVLFNILDNAIEACRSSGSEEPHLSLSLTSSKGFLSVLVRNSKNPQEVFDHTTTKNDSFYHGLGLSIIEDICHKYDGSWQWNDCGNTFESVILLHDC